MININLVNWPQRAAVGCVIGVDVHPSGQYTYPYPIMKLPIVMPQDRFYTSRQQVFDSVGDTVLTLLVTLLTVLVTRIAAYKNLKSQQ